MISNDQLIYNQIQHASQNNQLVVFIGAGMSNNFGYPTWNGLVKRMYQELTGKVPAKNKVFSSDELLQIPQALRSNNRKIYEKIIKEYFCDKKGIGKENAILDEVMELKSKHIITTNFDPLIERYLEDKENAFTRMHSAAEGYARLIRNKVPYHYFPVIKDSDMITADANHLLIKMHGDIQNMDALVLCEDDYLNYSNSHVLIENFIKSLLINHTFLFVGYGVGDSNLKLIMNWVDHIASKEKKIADKRQKHFLLYSEKKPMDAFVRKYFEEKQIMVLEKGNLPAKFRKQTIQEFPAERGKNLLKLLKMVNDKANVDIPDTEKLREVLAYAQNQKVVHIWEICSRYAKEEWKTWKKGNELILMRHLYADNLLEQVIRTAKSKKDEKQAILARRLLGKLGISGSRSYLGDKFQKVPNLYNDTLEVLCLTHNDSELQKYVYSSGEFNEIEKAYWMMYANEEKKTEKAFEKLLNSRKKRSLYEQLQITFNLQQLFELEQKYGMHFAQLWNHLPVAEKKKFVLLNEYMSECQELYQAFGKEADKLRMRYAAQNTGGEEFMPPQLEFEVHRTEILDFVRYMVLNGFYIAGAWSQTTHIEGLRELILSYVDALLFLMAPEIRRKQSWFKFTRWDIYLLLNLIDSDKLKAKIEGYKVAQLVMDESCRKILRDSCMNLLRKVQENLKCRNYNGYRQKKILENCFYLMKLVSWDEDEIQPIINEVTSYLSKLLNLGRNERALEINTGILYDFLEFWFDHGQKGPVVAGARKLLHQLAGNFLKEDHDSEFSIVLELNMDSYRDTGLLSCILKGNLNTYDKKVVNQFWKIYKQDYPSHVSFGLADIYLLGSARIKQEISRLMNKKVRGMEVGLIRYCLEIGALTYGQQVKEVLLRKCEVMYDMAEDQRKRSFMYDSPLTHVLRLFQKGIIQDMNPYHKYKEMNKWFSFVCFPAEFDFSEFEVEGWCSWLEAEPYKSYMKGKNKEILQKLFKNEIAAGAGEEVRRIYYKYLEGE